MLAVTKGLHTVSASVGCAVYPDDAETAAGLMQVSDAAMYGAQGGPQAPLTNARYSARMLEFPLAAVYPHR